MYLPCESKQWFIIKCLFLLCLCLHVEECLRILKEGIFGCVSSHIILTWTHHRLGPYTSLSSTRQVVNYINLQGKQSLHKDPWHKIKELKNYTARTLQMANLRKFFLSAFCFVVPIVMCSLWLFIQHLSKILKTHLRFVSYLLLCYTSFASGSSQSAKNKRPCLCVVLLHFKTACSKRLQVSFQEIGKPEGSHASSKASQRNGWRCSDLKNLSK